MSIESKNVAAWMTAQGAPIEVKQAPMPVPESDEIVVQAHSVAFNPVDGMMFTAGILIQKYPTVGGCDVAGIVSAVGKWI